LIVEEALENEVKRKLGRSYYAHAQAVSTGQCNDKRVGMVASNKVKTALLVPQERGIAGWSSEVR
jgi:hypothetical protein